MPLKSLRYFSIEPCVRARILPALLLWVLVPTVDAQVNTFLLPDKSFASTAGNTYASSLAATGSLPIHQQFGYDTTNLPSSAWRLKALAFRRPGRGVAANRPNPATSVKLVVALSVGPKPPEDYVLDFAKNHGNDYLVVFSGTVSWPTSPVVSNPPFHAKVPLTKPFIFIPRLGKSLVVDIRTLASSQAWYVDAVRPKGTSRNSWGNHTGFFCKDRHGRIVRSVLQEPNDIVPGGVYSPTYDPCPVRVIGLATIGTVGVGKMWGNRKLPIQVPGAPGCWWATNSLLMWPFWTGNGRHCKVPPLKIPYDPRLVGVVFYDQPAFLDTKANAAGIVTTYSKGYRIGSAWRVMTLLKPRDSTPPAKKAEAMGMGMGPIIQFTY